MDALAGLAGGGPDRGLNVWLLVQVVRGWL